MLWKGELRQLLDESARRTAVSPFPLGASKWDKTGRRLFSFFSPRRRGNPQVSYEVIFQRIAAAATHAACGYRVNGAPICARPVSEFSTNRWLLSALPGMNFMGIGFTPFFPAKPKWTHFSITKPLA